MNDSQLDAAREAVVAAMHREMETPWASTPEGFAAFYKRLDGAVFSTLDNLIAVARATPSPDAHAAALGVAGAALTTIRDRLRDGVDDVAEVYDYARDVCNRLAAMHRSPSPDADVVGKLAWEGGNVPQSVHLAHDERCSACNDAARWLARLRKAAYAATGAEG